MPLSWNEIRSRALAFSKEWIGESREHAEAKSFWDGFFQVFGHKRRQIASFEEPVKNLKGHYSFIDLFWKGMLLAEHKSLGKDLGKAHTQAMEYIQDLQREGRGEEVPRYVVISDFAHIALHDLEESTSIEFPLAEFYKYIKDFAFIPGYKQHSFEPQDPINIQAVQIMGDLHDALEAGGYSGHELERLLVRILFCLFAEDTGLFDRDAFRLYLENHTKPDGSDLGPQLAQFFQTLNTREEIRQKNLLDELVELPYVNGELFAEPLNLAAFDRGMRTQLLAASARFEWSQISPAVFGALFQEVIEPKERRQIGAHYTSERDILKVIGPLFLDDLKAELDKAGRDKKKLQALHERLGKMKLLDPACGCGNFLVISYRELRLLELDILRRLLKKAETQKLTDISTVLRLDVDQMYGIEIEEWPVRIAEVAMWLMDHQMNQQLSEEFGNYFVRLPLRKSPHIHHGNALRVDWNEVLPASECTYVLGNPPFVGKKARTNEQQHDMSIVLGSGNNKSILDYVCCWYVKAGSYSQNRGIDFAFVSTNSITQGEHPGVLWPLIRFVCKHSIRFAYRTFAWESEARGKAHVHVVIIAMSEHQSPKRLYDSGQDGRASYTTPNIINAYLVDAPDALLENRSRSVCKVPQLSFGNMPNDGGHLLLTAKEVSELVKIDPEARKFIRPFVSAKEYLNGIDRFCIWLEDASPSELKKHPEIRKRVELVKKYRNASKRVATLKLAKSPMLFGEIRQPNASYVVIPRHSSENRAYIPMGFIRPLNIVADSCLALPNAKLYHFGILTSTMHMAWVRYVAGRLKSDYRYSAKLVYNNFPWPQDVSAAKYQGVETAAQAVLDAREAHPEASLADLYDPLSMPANLAKAHEKLDRAVDRCYRPTAFANERVRVEYLFTLYQKLTEPLLAEKKPRRKST